jgi:N-acetylglucosamine kinase-like BadF-type ATPase
LLGIGFDSGGSHTTYALDRGYGTVALEANECSESISDARGERSTRAAISWIMRVISSQTEDDICAWIGAAGFSAASAANIRQMFEPHIGDLRASGRNVDILVANDGVSLLKSPPLSGSGLAAIVGTGSVVMGAHPSSSDGVVRRGGFEWLCSDEGAGVWMTLECIRALLKDIQAVGSNGYHSPLLDRLCDYFNVEAEYLTSLPNSHLQIARADLLARVVAEGRTDSKRRIAGFVYPHLFDLASLSPGRSHDRLAAEVISSSVRVIAQQIDEVSQELAAYTADRVNDRERLAVIVGGNIAKNPYYEMLLETAVSECKFVKSIDTVGDASQAFAGLARSYVEATGREQREYAKSFDPLHPVLKLT